MICEVCGKVLKRDSNGLVIIEEHEECAKLWPKAKEPDWFEGFGAYVEKRNK